MKGNILTVAVVEDQKEFSDALEAYLTRYGQEKNLPIDIRHYQDGEAFVEEYRGNCQIIFMDIAMPHMNGLEAAKRLRKVDPAACLIFITNMAQYAIRGYEVSALDFVLKPMSYEIFCIKMDKAVAHVHVDETYSIRIPGGIKRIHLSDLDYIESSKHYLYYHVGVEEYRERASMRDVSAFFEERGFALVNTSLMVNLARMEMVHSGDVLIAGQTFGLSRTCKAGFLAQMSNFLGNGGR